MRNISSGGLTQIAKRLTNEPINIIEVAWSIGGSPVPYADRDIASIPGKITELATLDNVVNVSGNGQSQSIAVTLDDTDGSLKTILNTNDIHQRSVWVYQYFEGMSLTDKFLLFKGQISSPVTYSEANRSLSFTVLSQLEDKEIGFSADDGKFDFVADELIGKAWPMCFGTVVQGKTLKLTSVYKGILAKSFGVPDFALPYRRDALTLLASFWASASSQASNAAEKHRQMSEFYSGYAAGLSAHVLTLNPVTDAAAIAELNRRIPLITQLASGESQTYSTNLQNADTYQRQANSYAIGAESVSAIYNRQVAAMPATVRIVDGEAFPRGNIQLKIADTVLKGSFIGATNEFHITAAIHPQQGKFIVSNVPIETGIVGTPMNLANAGYAHGDSFYTLVTSGDGLGTTSAHTAPLGNFTLGGAGSVAVGDTFVVVKNAPSIQTNGHGALDIHQLPGVRISSVTLHDTRIPTNPPAPTPATIPEIELPGVFFLFDSFPADLLAQYSLQMFGDNAGYIFNEAGSVVQLYTPETQTYIVSIVPGTVLSVSAFLTKNGIKKLVTVPAEYYTVTSHNYGGGLTAVQLNLTDALSKDTVGGEWGDELYVTFQSDVGPNTVDVLAYLIDTYTELTTDTDSFAAVHTALANYPSHFQITDRKNILEALSEIAWQARCSIWLSNDVFYLRYLPAEPDSVTTFTDSDIDVGTMELGFTGTEDITTKMVCKWRATGAQPEDNTAILRYNVKKYGTKEKDFNFYIYNKVDFVLKSATFWLIRYANTWKKIKFQTPLHKLNVESLDGVTLDFNQPWMASAPVVGIVEQANYNSDTEQLEFSIWTPVRAGEMTQYDFAYPADIDEELKFPTDADEALEFDGGDGPGKNVGEGQSLGVPGNFATEYTNPDFYKFLTRLFSDRGQPHPSDVHDTTPGAPVIKTPPTLTRTGPGPTSPPTNNITPTPQVKETPAPSTSPTSGGSATSLTFETPIVDNTDPDNPVSTTLGTFLIYDPDAEIHAAKLAYLWDEDNDP